jgi:arabinofuranosyltransferase
VKKILGAQNTVPLLIAILFAAHAFFYFVNLGSDAVDDAYISFRYALNAIRGHGLVFNPTERVEGFTNFLWTVMFIPLEGAHMDAGRASMIIGGLFGLGVIFLTLRFSKLAGAPPAVGWLAAFFLAADGSFVLWSVGGLETPMFAFLIFAGAMAYVLENKAERRTINDKRWPNFVRHLNNYPVSGIFFALAAMTRPEGAFVFAITIAHQAAWRLLAERRLLSNRDLARVVGFAALFGPYWLARWGYYHSFLPNSFHAKVNTTGPLAQIERGWNHLSQFVGVHLGWLIAAPPLVNLATSVAKATTNPRSRDSSLFILRAFWTTYFASILAVYLAYIVYVGGDWSVGRFFVPLLALYYILFSAGLVDMWHWFVEKLGRAGDVWLKSAGIGVAALLVFALNLASSWKGEYGIYIKDFEAGKATVARETMGKWLKTNAPRGTLIAVDAAGQVPYFSELPAVDMFGINDLHIGRMNVDTLGQGTPGHEKMDIVYVILRQPEYVIIYGDLFDSVKEYERAPATWTYDESLKKFLTLYQKRKP